MTLVRQLFFIRIAALLGAFAIAAQVVAHGNLERITTAEPSGKWTALLQNWALDPAVVIPLAVAILWYLAGLRNLWRSMQIGKGIRKWEAGCYFAGWLALVIALASPLHPWGALLFSAHMTQHEILMLIAAPLMVLGRPMIVFLKALPPAHARWFAHAVNSSAWQPIWRLLTNSFVAWLIHAMALWIWHLPVLFQSTIDNDSMHALQHASFLGSALLFWWAVIHGRHRAAGYGLAVAYMFTTALHSGLLGALLTFAQTLWYPVYAQTAPDWGLTGLQDQQLGGLIMWIPAGLVYIVAGLALFAGWMREGDRKVALWAQPTSEPITGN